MRRGGCWRCAPIHRVVVGGGDATVNRAISASLECGLPLGIIPLGAEGLHHVAR
ncbi:MAG: diacylglycerol kinase family protein [Gammaproteobacteria bacterium]